ncbi:MAG: hypothetical protein GY951_04215 [Psychromonas sp.]|nr:hypothetical protein [Psychromonas sp.]
MEEITKLLVNVESGETSPVALVDWAADQISAGNDSISLNELAWLNNPSMNEAKELFVKSIKELKYPLPSKSEMLNYIARTVAKQIVEGEKDINESCSKLCEISRELNSPKDLSVFELLAHEQYDHENIGINAENIQPEIVKEAARLVNET